MSRRRFLGGTTAALLGGGALAAGLKPARASTCSFTIDDEEISIQLYTTLAAGTADMEHTLQLLAAIGYRNVEHAGFGSTGTAPAFRTALDNAGLRCTSGHSGIPFPYNDTVWRQIVSDAAVVGQRFIVDPSRNGLSPSTNGRSPTPVADWQRFAATMNQAGAVAREAGIERVAHHCHWAEWLATSDDPDRTGVDVMAAELDPDLCHIQMDVGWCYAATGDPAGQMRRYPGLFPQLHIKDMTPYAGAPGLAPQTAPVTPGAGALGNPALAAAGGPTFDHVFAAARETGTAVLEYIVEQDASPTGFDAAVAGWTFLHGRSVTYEC